MKAKNILKKWFICVTFSFMLTVVVWLSEVIRLTIEDVKKNPFIPDNMLYFFVMILGVVPLVLLLLWLLSPSAIKKLLETFGLSEESEKKEEKKS